MQSPKTADFAAVRLKILFSATLMLSVSPICIWGLSANQNAESSVQTLSAESLPNRKSECVLSVSEVRSQAISSLLLSKRAGLDDGGELDVCCEMPPTSLWDRLVLVRAPSFHSILSFLRQIRLQI